MNPTQIERIHDPAAICDVINEAAQAYRGVIPAECWHEPYMPLDELRSELAAGVRFFGVHKDGALAAVMGLQHVADVSLVRHAYTRTASQGAGIGTALLEHLKRENLKREIQRPLLIGTWKAATWAIAFYERRGFRRVGDEEKVRLLQRYWTVPARQIAESVVLSA